MTATTDFIAELYRAANEVKKITPFEKRWLIERAVTTIHDLREQVLAAAPVGPADVLEEIEAVGRNIAIEPDQLVAHELVPFRKAKAHLASQVYAKEIPRHYPVQHRSGEPLRPVFRVVGAHPHYPFDRATTGSS